MGVTCLYLFLLTGCVCVLETLERPFTARHSSDDDDNSGDDDDEN